MGASSALDPEVTVVNTGRQGPLVELTLDMGQTDKEQGNSRQR